MRRTVAIASAVLVVAAACGTPTVEDADGDVGAAGTRSTQASEQVASTPADQTDVDEVTTTTEPATAYNDTPTTTTDPTTTESTTRDTSPSDGATGSSVPSVDPGDDNGDGEDAVTGQVPAEFMNMVFAHAESHTGRAASEMSVVRSEAVTWPDGSLGCPEPGMSYTQALVPGYWVEIAVGDEVLDYRLSENGGMKLCEIDGLVPSPRDDT